MAEADRILVFIVDGRKLALPLACAEAVLRAVAVTPLPGAPAVAMGVIALRGAVIPVLDPRLRLGLPATELDPGDCLIVARARRRRLALRAEAVLGIPDDPGPVLAPDSLLPGLESLRGIKRVGADIILIYDLDGFLSLAEEEALGAAVPAWR